MKLVCASLCFITVYFSFLIEAHSTSSRPQPTAGHFLPVLPEDPTPQTDGAEVASASSAEVVRVRLLTTSKRINITGLGLKFQNINRPYRPVAIPDNARAEVRVMERQGKKIWALRLNGRDPEHLFAEKYLLIQGSQLRAGTQPLPEKVLLAKNGAKNVDVVGVVPLDDYLVGVLSSEMPLSWPLETLKAQAVAARSYALAVMSERQNEAYHLESSILDQVFRHVKAGDESNPLVQKAIQAVNETKDIKLLSGDKKVLKAFFHSDCGGKTTTAKNVWNSGVNTGVAVDMSCPTNPKAHWKLSLTKEELSRRLKVADLNSVSLIKVPSEGRIRAVRLAFNQNETKTLSANDFRQMLGFQELRSSLFVLKKVGESFTFEGQGFGHGVGLCQWGSRALGRNGLNFKQILKHYYPLASLQ